MRDLRCGDLIRDDAHLAGRATAACVTAELGRDLAPWYAIRLQGGRIRGVDDLDATVERLAATPPGQAAAIPDDQFTAPAAMARLVELAMGHRRDYRVAHHTDSYGRPMVSLALGWFPAGCDVPTRIELTWHSHACGTYRLSRASAQGLHRGHRRTSDARRPRTPINRNTLYYLTEEQFTVPGIS